MGRIRKFNESVSSTILTKELIEDMLISFKDNDIDYSIKEITANKFFNNTIFEVSFYTSVTYRCYVDYDNIEFNKYLIFLEEFKRLLQNLEILRFGIVWNKDYNRLTITQKNNFYQSTI